MNRFCLSVMFALPAGLVFPAVADEEGAKPGTQRGATFEKKLTQTLKAKYLIYTPPDFGKDPGKKYPMIMFLHGSGERGDDLELVKLHGPPKVVQTWKGFPFVVVSPQCPAGQWWDPDVVVALLDEVLAKHKQIDRNRVYLTGLSMGGFGTWDTAVAYPDRWAAIAPICGGGNPYRALEIKHIPVWIFHGTKDESVPIMESEFMAAVMKRVGGDVRFTRYPEAGHDVWTQTYSQRGLYDWFLQHKRGQKPSPPTTAPTK